MRVTVLVVAMFCVAGRVGADSTVIVDPTIRYQTWQGWGTSLAWWAKVVGGLPEPARTDYMEKAFDPVKGLGLNIVRYNIGGGENPEHLTPNKQFLEFRAAIPGYEPSPGHWDWNADPNQRWVLQRALKMGANQVEAFANSPPWWMTVSGSVTGNQKGKDNLRQDADGAFAAYLTAVVQHFHDDWHIPFRDLEPLNEPSGGWSFGNGQEGCHVDRPHQNAVLEAVSAALARNDISGTTLTASDEPSIGDADKTFPFYDAAVLHALTKINTHSYGGGDRTQLFDFANSVGKDLWLSEDGDGDGSGLHMSRQILDDVRGLHASAWVYWQVVDIAGGWGLLQSSQASETDTAYTVNKKYYVMGQYSKFIRPGDQIIAVDDASSLAAYDAHHQALVIVTTNDTDKDTSLVYDLSRFTRLGRSVSVHRTSPAENLARLPDITLLGSRYFVNVPAKSVTTYVINHAEYHGPLGINFRDYYRLVNVQSGLDLGVALAATAGGASVVQTNGKGDPSQQWDLIGVGDGNYKVINRASGLTLDVNQSSKTPGSGLIQYSDNGGSNQLWRLADIGDGEYLLVNRNSGLVLDGGGNAVGGRVIQNRDGLTTGQHWRLVLMTTAKTRRN